MLGIRGKKQIMFIFGSAIILIAGSIIVTTLDLSIDFSGTNQINSVINRTKVTSIYSEQIIPECSFTDNTQFFYNRDDLDSYAIFVNKSDQISDEQKEAESGLLDFINDPIQNLYPVNNFQIFQSLCGGGLTFPIVVEKLDDKTVVMSAVFNIQTALVSPEGEEISMMIISDIGEEYVFIKRKIPLDFININDWSRCAESHGNMIESTVECVKNYIDAENYNKAKEEVMKEYYL